ncbi:tudor domain-containing protein 5 isoform X2 [Tribolium castaneum]|uniref:Uncharacterized protein n=1 Tax=Tribolium castaneum TaxID=7070 RepID=D6WD76_TRICA|nr:PREDICTED: tudor domain-containing protein 5 isoform X2 [Tribolium castaneum]EEZ98350.2 hypothetical protein TcasGA2_TC000805 [Tribolium castaneum]|eukprot:XP_008201321.1 PREDICTED: tudor domain-containing protein 5 isoform X2 [Tribolium castaneum]
MAPSEATETKCIITSLLTSNPLRCSIAQLCDDFRNIVGYPIPIDKLGFKSVEAYLKSIPDTVKVYGTGPDAEVQGIIKEKSAHINLMVAKQKTTSIPPHKRSRMKFIPSGYQKNYNAPRRPTRFNTNKCNEFFRFPIDPVVAAQEEEIISPSSDEPCLNNEPQIQDCDYREKPHEDKVFVCDREAISQIEPKKDEKVSSSDTSSLLSPVETKTDHSAPFALNESNEVSPSNSNVPTKVENNLKQLILQFPNGLWCTKLPSEYRQMFNKKLNYEYYGYKSLIQMCADLPHIFHFIRPGMDDFLLFDISRPLPTLTKSETVKNELEVEDVATTHILDELALDWTAGSPWIPPDVMRLSDEIPRFFPPNVAIKDILDVTVEEIYDLSKFWVTLTYGDLKDLMDDLQTFFDENHSKYLIPEKLLAGGLFCVALYGKTYHRCVIVDMLPRTPGFIRVFFVDYGTVENVPSKEIWFLPKQFSEVPCQAIRVRLASIYPPYENSTWSEQAIVAFQKLVTNRVVVGEVTKIDEKQFVFELYMADITNEKNIFYINDRLVNEGHAIYTDQERKRSYIDYDCTPNVQYLHLFPEFFEIESGLAPTNEEMKYIIANKLPLHHYMPQYFNIYYFEDVEQIQTQHEKFNKKKLKDHLVYSEEEDFDFSFFPDSLQSEIKDLLEQDIKTKLCGDQIKTDKLSKLGADDLIHGTSTKTENDSMCYRARSVSSLDLNSLSDVSCSSESSPDIFPLNNSFKQLNLNNSDLSVLSHGSVSHKSTNPFLNGDLSVDKNPFRLYNPFTSDEDQTSSSSNVFSKTPEEKLPDQIVNNLNDNNLNESACGCKLKQVNLDKSNLNSNKTLSNPFKAFEKNEKQQPTNAQVRVRTPPGFASQNGMIPNTSFMNFVPNNFLNNPYYQRFAYSQYNQIYAQNQLMTQSVARFYGPGQYPNQFNFNANAWNQTFNANAWNQSFNANAWNQMRPPNFNNFRP